MKKTLTQIAREFWIPMLGAALWAAYEYCCAGTSADRSLSGLIKAFGASFFFISWLLAQWFRIQKQQKVDGHLSTIDKRVTETLESVQARTGELMSHITGGDSVCYLDVYEEPDLDGNLNSMAIRHFGKYPLYDVAVHIANIDDYDRRFGQEISFRDYHSNRQYADAGVLPVGLVSNIKCTLPVRRDLRYNVHFYARNGDFVQQLYLHQVPGGRLARATRVLRGDVVVYENISPDFVFEASGKIDWWKHTPP
jgi:hypothetical protein